MRQISGKRGSTTRGWVDIMDFSHCGDERCPSCNQARKALKDAMAEQMSEYSPSSYISDEVGQWEMPGKKPTIEEIRENVKKIFGEGLWNTPSKENIIPYVKLDLNEENPEH